MKIPVTPSGITPSGIETATFFLDKITNPFFHSLKFSRNKK